MFTKEDTPTHVVKVYPQASDLFKLYNINFCCKGDLTIESQCIDKDIKADAVVLELNEKYAEWKKEEERKVILSDMGLKQLTEEIFLKQRLITEELSSLKQYVERVNLVHGNEQPHLKRLEILYNDLERLMTSYLEQELILLSLMKDPQSKSKLSLETEEDKFKKNKRIIEDLLLEIKQITNGLTPPVNACGTYRITYSRLSQIDRKISDHLQEANNWLLNFTWKRV